MTIAPTGAGKGVGCVVPAILRHDGAVIVMDVKGENYAMTRRHRAESGSKVYCVDPFDVCTRLLAKTVDIPVGEIAGFNPFDLLPYLSDDHASACRTLADMLISKDGHKHDPFWREAALGVLAALIDCYNSFEGPMRSLSALVRDLGTEVTSAGGPGYFPEDFAISSAIEADLDLMRDLEDAALTPNMVLSAYDQVKEFMAPHPDSEAFASLLRNTALETLIQRTACEEPYDPAKLAESVVKAVTSPKIKFQKFCATLYRPEDMTDEINSLSGRLWRIISNACDTSAHWGAPEGSYAENSFGDGVPEGFPLAMHRLARHPGSLARSAVAQATTAADKTWSSIILITRSAMAEFSGTSIARTLSGQNSIDLDALRDGADLSIYLAFPPNRIRSHASLFRVMVEGLLCVITSRTSRPHKRTLLLLDEIAQLGHIDLLVTATTLLRGYGVQVWSFWQDISQLTGTYPADWQTILNNCRIIQVFGRGLSALTSDLARALDINPQDILQLADTDLLAWIDTHTPITLRRPVCYSDPELRDLCDPSPFILRPAEDLQSKTCLNADPEPRKQTASGRKQAPKSSTAKSKVSRAQDGRQTN